MEEHGGVQPLAAEWDALADEVGAAPWLRPAWVDAWWRAFGEGRLLVLAARDGGQLAAVLPLAEQGRTLAAPANWHTPEFGILARTGGHRAELARLVFERRPHRVTMSFVDELDDLERAARTAGYRVITRVRQRSPYVPLGDDFDAYLATLDRKHVKEVRRRRRRLEEHGAVTFEIATDTTGFDEFLRVEAAGWKGKEGTAIVSTRETEMFYREIAEWAAQRGSLRLASLTLDGRAIAFELLLEENATLYFVKGGYDEDLRRFAPGHLIAYELLAEAVRRRVRCFEFLGSDEPFKLEWTRDVHERLHFDAFAPSPAGLAAFAAERWGRPLAKRLLQLRR